MDVMFVAPQESFIIEIGYFDTVLEIKEKIQKYRKIPTSQQILIFNGKVLEDNGDVDSCVILHRSKIHLRISTPHNLFLNLETNNNNNDNKPHENPRLKNHSSYYYNKNNKRNKNNYFNFIHHSSNNPSVICSKKVEIVFHLPTSKTGFNTDLVIDVDLSDSVEQLKRRIHHSEGYPAHLQALYINRRNVELQDNRNLYEYELKNGSEIDILIRPPQIPSMIHTVSTVNSKKLKVIVVTKSGTMKLPVEVNPFDKVQVLRKELEKLQQKVKFELPEEGYFFIYKQGVMEEKETFRGLGVRQDDTIEIFNGSVTGGQ